MSYKGRVDLSTLPDELLASVQAEFSEEKLSSLAKLENNPFATDQVIYELQYQDSGKKFSINESQVSDEIMELVDSLSPYIEMLPKKDPPD